MKTLLGSLVVCLVVLCVSATLTKKSACLLISDQGFVCDEQTVQTEDGYVLTMHHIPPITTWNGKVVYLQHGLVDSSATWVIGDRSQSLGFILAAAGYDVWLGNNRGNDYSLGHVSLNIDSEDFWMFTFDEMAKYDLPAMINHVKDQTGAASMTYVCHSQGCTQALIGLQQRPELQDMLNGWIMLAPAANVSHTTSSALRVLAGLRFDWMVMKVTGKLRFSLDSLCSSFPTFCAQSTCMLAGCESADNMDFDAIGSAFPAGSSSRSVAHYTQMVRSGKFQAFDWGSASANVQHYGTATPPIYDDFSRLTVPTHLFWGRKDKLADPIDVQELINKFPPSNLHVHPIIENYGHGSFVWGLDAHTVLYPELVSLIDSLSASFPDRAATTSVSVSEKPAKETSSSPSNSLLVFAVVTGTVVLAAVAAVVIVLRGRAAVAVAASQNQAPLLDA